MNYAQKLMVEMAIRSAREMARCCITLGLDCVDAPASSSRLLEDLGYSQYRIRSFWSVVRSLSPLRIPLYVYNGARGWIKAVYYDGPFYEHVCGRMHIPLSSRGGVREAVRVPHGSLLYLVLEVSVDGFTSRMNVIRLLTLLYRSSAEAIDALLRGLVSYVWGDLDAVQLVGMLRDIISGWRNVIGSIIPLPAGWDDVGRYIPVLNVFKSGPV
ncbi:MAG: hypothetical protein DSY37_03110 [Hyperthermus sp.]|nr:MAG: hypothetical protein DSY37_03110 [Hyperthermus sp.]